MKRLKSKPRKPHKSEVIVTVHVDTKAARKAIRGVREELRRLAKMLPRLPR
jgi:uncharacterized protein YggU (UPF0235/DUF167 family)